MSHLQNAPPAIHSALGAVGGALALLLGCTIEREVARPAPLPPPAPNIPRESPCIDPTDRRYGAVPNDELDDAAALNLAIQDGDLCIPAGVYLLSTPLIAASHRRIRGDASMRTELRDTGNYAHIIEAHDVEDLEIESLSFDLNGSLTCATGVALRAVRDIHIHHNRFRDRSPQHDRCDNWAISFGSQGYVSERVHIHDNAVSGEMQLTANGGTLRDARIERNQILDGRTSGISITACRQENVTIANNKIEKAGVGIFVGKDQGKPNPSCWLRDVDIVDNLVKSSRERTAGIMVQAHDVENRRIRIVRNRVEHTSPTETKGITLELDGQQITDSVFQDTLVLHNVIEGAGFGASAIAASDASFVENEIVGGGIGLSLERSKRVSLLSNGIRRAATGIVVRGSDDVLVRRNQVLDSAAAASFSYALVLLAYSADPIPQTRVVATENVFGDTRSANQKSQDYAVVQTGDGSFATHFRDNDFSSNRRGPFQQGRFETWENNHGPLAAPAQGPPTSRTRALVALRLEEGRHLGEALVVVPAAERGDQVSIERQSGAHTGGVALSAWAPRAGVVQVIAHRADASAILSFRETVVLGIRRSD